MKSKKLLLIASSFFVIGTLASCGRNENEGLSAEFKTEKRYGIGETISKDDIRVTYTKGNSVKELESKDFNVEGFTDGKYTFKDGDGELGKREKTFNVTYNKLKTTVSTEAFNGQVSVEEFCNAIDSVKNISADRNFACDIDLTLTATGEETKSFKSNVLGKGYRTKIVSNIDQWKGGDPITSYEDYDTTYHKYFKYDNKNDKDNNLFKSIDNYSELDRQMFYFVYFDYYELFFDNEKCFNKETREYEFGFEYSEEGTGEMKFDVKIGINPNLRVSYVNDNITEHLSRAPGGTLTYDVKRTFTYDPIDPIVFDNVKPINKMKISQDGKSYVSDAVEMGADLTALFSLQIVGKEFSSNPQNFYIFNDQGQEIKPSAVEEVILGLYTPTKVFEVPEVTEGGNFAFTRGELVGEKTLLFEVTFNNGTLSNPKVALTFTPDFEK